MDSHEFSEAIFRPRSIASRSGDSTAARHKAINSSCECATFTTDPKLEITSGTALLTMSRPVAMYSNDLVGLMYSVCSFMANGIRQTSKPLQQAGKSL